MGADLLLAIVSLPTGQEPDWEAAQRHLADLSDKVLARTEMAKMGGVDTARSSAATALKNLRLYWEGAYRDADTFTIGDRDVLITGGTSWGESPGEGFEAINELGDIPGVLRAAGFE